METCTACEGTPEHFRCPVCGMTGPEIYEARFPKKDDGERQPPQENTLEGWAEVIAKNAES